MKSQDFSKFKLPDTPGVYFFKRGMETLYVGKASSLHDRVRSYFSADLIETRGPRIIDMVAKADRVSFQKTDSVLEALLLEAELIKKWKPPYNSEGKDDKSFSCVVITNEDFPRVLIVRQKDIDFSSLKAKSYKLKAIYGPFPHGSSLKEALRIIRKIFPYRDPACKPMQGHSCFNRQIGLCPGTCTGEISKEDYAKIIRNLLLFFHGKKPRLLKLLLKEMKIAAKRQEFEKAGELKRQLFALKHIQDIALLRTSSFQHTTSNFRIEAYDLSHFGGKDIVGAMAVVESGEARTGEYRLFKIRGTQEVHEALGLKELLRRRFNHTEWKFPELIVMDGNEVQKRAAEETLCSLRQLIPVIAPVKDEGHRPRELLGDKMLCVKHRREILLANSEAHRFALKFQRRRRNARIISLCI